MFSPILTSKKHFKTKIEFETQNSKLKPTLFLYQYFSRIKPSGRVPNGFILFLRAGFGACDHSATPRAIPTALGVCFDMNGIDNRRKKCYNSLKKWKNYENNYLLVRGLWILRSRACS